VKISHNSTYHKHFSIERLTMKDLTRQLSKIMILLLLMTTANFNAQFSGGLQGTVEGSTGVAVSNGKVTLLNQDTQVSLQATSDAARVYRFGSLAPGSYVVSASTSGFGTTAVSFSSRPLRHAIYPSN
jgi:hypothetical protein